MSQAGRPWEKAYLRRTAQWLFVIRGWLFVPINDFRFSIHEVSDSFHPCPVPMSLCVFFKAGRRKTRFSGRSLSGSPRGHGCQM